MQLQENNDNADEKEGHPKFKPGEEPNTRPRAPVASLQVVFGRRLQRASWNMETYESIMAPTPITLSAAGPLLSSPFGAIYHVLLQLIDRPCLSADLFGANVAVSHHQLNWPVSLDAQVLVRLQIQLSPAPPGTRQSHYR